jgi:exodeoxyribonuclease V beta subunit
VKGWWASPDALRKAIAPLRTHAASLPPADAPAVALARAAAEAAASGRPESPVGGLGGRTRTLFDDARKAKAFDARKLNSANCARWLDALQAWADDPLAVAPELSETAWTRLTPAGLAEIWWWGTPPAHPAFAALADLPEALAALPDGHDGCSTTAPAGWPNALPKSRRGAPRWASTTCSPASTRPSGAPTARAWPSDPQPVSGGADRRVPGHRRDPVPHLRRHLPGRGQRRGHRLVLIGDPKQAIYAFRGADIYTYLAARAAAGRLLHPAAQLPLDPRHGGATNRCFQLAEAQDDGQGAFLFRSAAGNPVPFLPAAARGARTPAGGRRCRAGSTSGACRPGRRQADVQGAYLEAMADVCASEMVRLLNLGQRGEAGFRQRGGGLRRCAGRHGRAGQ